MKHMYESGWQTDFHVVFAEVVGMNKAWRHVVQSKMRITKPKPKLRASSNREQAISLQSLQPPDPIGRCALLLAAFPQIPGRAPPQGD